MSWSSLDVGESYINDGKVCQFDSNLQNKNNGNCNIFTKKYSNYNFVSKLFINDVDRSNKAFLLFF